MSGSRLCDECGALTGGVDGARLHAAWHDDQRASFHEIASWSRRLAESLRGRGHRAMRPSEAPR